MLLLWVNSNAGGEFSFGGKITTSIQLVRRVKWSLLMVLIVYGSNDESVIRKLNHTHYGFDYPSCF